MNAVMLAAVVLAAVPGVGGGATGGTPIAPGAKTPMHEGRKLVWSDEFDGNDLDPLKWKFRRSMNGTDCLYANDARTYSVTNGLLRLRVQKSGDPQKKFLLPEGVSTLDTMNYRYGYLEMRGRVPFRHGAWPSFWMQSAARSRTVDWMCETDVFEAFSSTNSLESAGHKWGNGKHCSTGGEKVGGKPFVFKDCSKLNEEFHVYGFEWNPREMKFYVDGVHYQTIHLGEEHDFTVKDGDLAGMGGFHDPEGIIFNNEIFTPGHGWCPEGRELTLADEPFPIEYDIDWVRLWQKPGSEERITYDLAKGGVIPEPKVDIFRRGEFFVGCNYWGSKAGVHMWRKEDWNPREIEKDLAALAAMGVEVMRVFPTWSEFQPITEYRRWGGDVNGVITEGAEQPLATVAGLDADAMKRFRFFCDTARNNNIKLMVSLMTGWMSGRLFFPRALEGKNLITDPDALMWEGRFARAFVREMRYHPAIVAWDLGNECNCMGKITKPAEAWNWLNTITSAVRMEDPSRRVVSGMHGQSSAFLDPWNLQIQGELLDVLTPHPYPAPWRVDANRGPFNAFRNAFHQVGQCLFYEGISGKPAFPQEVGSFGPTVVPDRLAALGYRQEMFASWMHGMNGFLWWCAFEEMHLDYPPFEQNAMERELGMLKADAARTPKPEAKALREFAAFKKSLPFKALPKLRVDAICLLSERTDFWQTSFGAFLLGKQAGIDLAFVGAENPDLPESKLYFVPSGENWETYSHRAWKRVLAKAKAGATVVVSRGSAAGYSDWQAVTGLEQEMWRAPRKVDFELDGRKLHATDAFTAVQRPVDCDVVARDATGNVVLSVRKYGKGKVIAINFQLEKLAMTTLANVFEGDFSNELWRLYAFAAREAGIERLVTRDDTRVAFTEHPHWGGRATTVCALNTRAETVKVPIRIARGQVKRIWNGKYDEKAGTLEIRGNDGCIFEVR